MPNVIKVPLFLQEDLETARPSAAVLIAVKGE
jgi:hypothetical protein